MYLFVIYLFLCCAFAGKPYMDVDTAGLDLEKQTIGQLDALVKALKKKSLETSLKQDEIDRMNMARGICRRKIIAAPFVWGQSSCDISIRG